MYEGGLGGGGDFIIDIEEYQKTTVIYTNKYT
jgi:hypothetical protein